MKPIVLLSALYILLLSAPIEAQTAAPPLFQIVQNGKYGYIDSSGKVVVQARFAWGSEFKDGYAEVYVCGRMVSMDENGDLSHLLRKEKLEARKVGDKFGFADASGQLKIPAQYDEARWFSEGLAAVRLGSKWGYIDETGHTAIAFQYADASAFKNGRAEVAFGELVRGDEGIKEVALNEDRNAVIDSTGRIVVKGLDSIGNISENRMAAEKNERWGYLDANGMVVIQFLYERASPFVDGLAAVQKDGKWGYINTNGQIAIPFLYEDADSFSEGFALVKKGGKSGYIDHNGDAVIAFQFDDASRFQTGLAAVTRGPESGFIDKSGNFAFELPFDYASDFRGLHDLAQYWTKDERFGYVDHSGRVVWESTQPETIEAKPLFDAWLEEHRETSCVGITEAEKQKIASFPPE